MMDIFEIKEENSQEKGILSLLVICANQLEILYSAKQQHKEDINGVLTFAERYITELKILNNDKQN